jgi:hypothetical protein
LGQVFFHDGGNFEIFNASASVDKEEVFKQNCKGRSEEVTTREKAISNLTDKRRAIQHCWSKMEEELNPKAGQ